MTVADLIARLQQFDPALPVVVSGFDESGFDYLETLKVVEIVRIAEARSHSGQFEAPDEVARPGARITASGEPFTALHLDF